jgi:hypothetical protein
VETFVFIVATITFTLPWKRPKLTVMQQALSRYYGNAIWCIDHVTKENLICHNIKTDGDEKSTQNFSKKEKPYNNKTTPRIRSGSQETAYIYLFI